jgi:hypothetical protein
MFILLRIIRSGTMNQAEEWDSTSVADLDNFDADPDPTSEKKLIRILLYVKF